MNTSPDHRSDLFSLGVVLYLLCCGAMPFGGDNPKAIVRKIQAGQYLPVVQLSPDVPPQLERLIDRLLAPKPEDRPQRGQEVVAALNEIMRQHGLEGSGQQIAEVLPKIFPQLAALGDGSAKYIPRAQTLTSSEGETRVMDSPGMDHPMSITPSAGTGHRPSDSSHSFQRVPATAPRTVRPSKQIPVALARTPQRAPRAPRGGHMVSLLLVTFVCGLIAFVAYMVMSSY